MFEKMKGFGTQVSTKAGDAVESLGNAASSVGEAINEKAVRASTAQACKILEIAMEELKGRPLADRPVSLTATVNFGIAALQMEIHLDASNKEMESDASS